MVVNHYGQTCSVRPHQFVKRPTGELVFGNPEDKSQYVVGRFASATHFEGLYKITVCNAGGGNVTVSIRRTAS
jgi:hypothetical protein